MAIGTAYTVSDSADSEELILRNIDIVKRTALHLSSRLPSSVQLEDLMQAGVVGLIEAARRYSPTSGTSFQSFAIARVRGAMLDDLRRGDWIPRSVHKRSREVAGAIRRLEGSLGREATNADIAQELGMSLREYHSLLVDMSNQSLISFEELIGPEEGCGIEPASRQPGPLSEVERSEMIDRLGCALGDLPERERLVLSLYYDDELNLREIGDVLSVSYSRVSQLLAQARLRLAARVQVGDSDTEQKGTEAGS
jgi:RNA polymerase sigma factor for flagellar operon FliA